ncbi:hypothetical protein FHG87_025191 [Trinorchestia longiramus]|nr:hypothetical protein FHG87_025191 [Trinorchestia longiramus]
MMGDFALTSTFSLTVSSIPERLTEQPWSCEVGIRQLFGQTAALTQLLQQETSVIHKTVSDLQYSPVPHGASGTLYQAAGTTTHTLQGYFQGTVVTLVDGTRVGVGTVVCRGTLASTSSSTSSNSSSTPAASTSYSLLTRSGFLSTLPFSSTRQAPQSTLEPDQLSSTSSTGGVPSLLLGTPKLIAADGYVLDNPDDLRLVLYDCTTLAYNCTDCTSTPFTSGGDAPLCGWCTGTGRCTSSTRCTTGDWLQVRQVQVY